MRKTISSILIWQTLRALVRNGNSPLTGRQLRIDKSRYTKDGTFLDALVSDGLLEVVTAGGPIKPKFKGSQTEPVQFRTTYKLTLNGLDAAETGEYNCPDLNPLPVHDRGFDPPQKEKPQKKSR